MTQPRDSAPLPEPTRVHVRQPRYGAFMENTASKNENRSIEAPLPLPLIPGRLMPWTKDRGIVAGGIAKFRAAEVEPLERWIPGMQFRAKLGGLVFSLAVERYIPATFIPWQTTYTRSRYGDSTRHDVLPRTIPHVVVVRVLGCGEPVPDYDADGCDASLAFLIEPDPTRDR